MTKKDTGKEVLDKLFGKRDESLGRTIHVSKVDGQGHVTKKEMTMAKLQQALSEGKTVVIHGDYEGGGSTHFPSEPSDGSEFEWAE